MIRRLLYTILFYLSMMVGFAHAGTPRALSGCSENVALCNFLTDLANHLNTLECLTADPNGSVLGVHGELKCASFGGSHYACMNTNTGPSKGTTWTCLNIGVSPTTGIFCGGTLSTSMNCGQFRGRIPVICTPTRVDLTVTTAPTGAALIVDVNECSAPTTCTTLFTTQANRPQIAASALSGNSTTFDDTSVALGNYIGFDIDQVGSTIAGSNLTVTLVCR